SLQLLSNPLGNVTLDCEYVSQLAIVSFGPDMRVVAGIDQLRADPNFSVRATDASFKNMRNTERLRDVPQVSCRARSIGPDTGTRNHFQVSNFRESGQNIVLHAIGEKFVFFA